jgi:hypothetical protein
VDVWDGGCGGNGITRLGEGRDIFKEFGSGNFDGGSGRDTLELAIGNYTVGIAGATVSFKSNGIIMNTSEFEKLIAASTTYDFTCLTDGQTINVV